MRLLPLSVESVVSFTQIKHQTLWLYFQISPKVSQFAFVIFEANIIVHVALPAEPVCVFVRVCVVTVRVCCDCVCFVTVGSLCSEFSLQWVLSAVGSLCS